MQCLTFSSPVKAAIEAAENVSYSRSSVSSRSKFFGFEIHPPDELQRSRAISNRGWSYTSNNF